MRTPNPLADIYAAAMRRQVAAMPPPATYRDAVFRIAIRDGLDLAEPASRNAAAARAVQEFPSLHAAWRAAGCPAMTFELPPQIKAGGPSTYEAAVHQIAKANRIDMSSTSGQGLACAIARVQYPHLHDAWRAAGFAPIDFVSRAYDDPSGPQSFRDAVHRIAARDHLDLATKPGQCAAAARAAAEFKALHREWREQGFPLLFD